MSSDAEKTLNEENLSAVQQARQEAKREIIEFVKMIAWFLVVFFTVKTYVIEGYEVQGPSMHPTLQDRERILVLKLPHILSQFRVFSGIDALKPGDIVVFDSPTETSKRYVKRVIAKGPHKYAPNTVVAGSQGDDPASRNAVRVRFEQGSVFVNNTKLAEPYLKPDKRNSLDTCEELRLQPGTYYVLGDHRSVSKDSRSFGSVDDSHLVGKALLCFWPPSRVRLLK